jgi:hypothetical protein
MLNALHPLLNVSGHGCGVFERSEVTEVWSINQCPIGEDAENVGSEGDGAEWFASPHRKCDGDVEVTYGIPGSTVGRTAVNVSFPIGMASEFDRAITVFGKASVDVGP